MLLNVMGVTRFDTHYSIFNRTSGDQPKLETIPEVISEADIENEIFDDSHLQNLETLRDKFAEKYRAKFTD